MTNTLQIMPRYWPPKLFHSKLDFASDFNLASSDPQAQFRHLKQACKTDSKSRIIELKFGKEFAGLSVKQKIILLRELTKFKTLVKLCFKNCNLMPQEQQWLKHIMQHLKQLHSFSYLEDNPRVLTANYIYALKALQVLHIYNLHLEGMIHPLSDDSPLKLTLLKVVAKYCNQLRQLNLSNNRLNSNELAGLLSNLVAPQLGTLNLAQNNFSAQMSFSLAPKLHNLRKLKLDATRISAKNWQQLSSYLKLDQLKSLSISAATYAELADKNLVLALAETNGLSNLAELNLSGLRISATEIKGLLTAAPALTNLNLQGCQMGSEAVLSLCQHPTSNQLQELNLSNNNIGERGLAALAEHGLWSQLTHLGLAGWYAEQAYVNYQQHAPQLLLALANLLQSVPNLRYLDLGQNYIKKQELELLLENPNLVNLIELDVSDYYLDNQLSEEYAWRLAENPKWPNLKIVYVPPFMPSKLPLPAKLRFK